MVQYAAVWCNVLQQFVVRVVTGQSQNPCVVSFDSRTETRSMGTQCMEDFVILFGEPLPPFVPRLFSLFSPVRMARRGAPSTIVQQSDPQCKSWISDKLDPSKALHAVGLQTKG